MLALCLTFPLWLAPASRLESLGDPQLNTYLIHWSGWALQHQLLDFFQANIFWPTEYGLAYGEHLLTQSLLVLPFNMLDAPPVLLHNLSLIQAYFFSALAAYALGWFYFRSVGAAFIAGLAYGFAPYRAAQSGHIQLVHGEFLPLMVLAFELALRGRPRARLMLALAAWAQWMTSWYWAVYTMWAFGPYLALRLWRMRRSLGLRGVARILLPLGVAALCALPMAIPYFTRNQAHAYVRPEEIVIGWSARLIDLITPMPRSLLYGSLGEGLRAQGDPERYLWLGFVPALGLLGAVALLAARWKAGRGQMDPAAFTADQRRFHPGLWLWITVLLLSFAFGTRYEGNAAHGLPMPMALLGLITPMGGQMRAAARWMLPALLGIALLSAWAWTHLPRNRPWGWVRHAACGWLALECLTRPIAWVPVESRRPQAIAWLDQQPFASPVLILPFEHQRYMLDAAWFGQPIVNGSNGYFPFGFKERMKRLENFPDAQALQELNRIGVRYILIDPREGALDASAWQNLLQPAGLSARAVGPHLIVELPPR